MTVSNPFILEKELSVFKTPVLECWKKILKLKKFPDKEAWEFLILKSNNWCNIIPVTEDGNVVMIRQYRIGSDEIELEIPGGVYDPNDQNIMASAIRELEEETGYKPHPDAKCLELGWVAPNPAIQGNRCYSFLVGPVSKQMDAHPDVDEEIEVIEVPLNKITDVLKSGEVTHALTFNAFFFLAMRSKNFDKVILEELQKAQDLIT